jgi:phosphate transport system protein
MLEGRITELRRELIEYGALVERMIERSVSGLLKRDKEMLSDVTDNDEPRANDYEIMLDEKCITMIAQYQPVAKDLRTIIMVLKINNDLERIADHAVTICENALFLIDRPMVKPLIDIPRMAESAISMVKDSIGSFVAEDVLLAKSVCERDSVVDALLDQVFRELITHMLVDAATIERSIRLISIARSLERIADLSTNICEDVIFMVQGKVIKHHQESMGLPSP